MSYFPIQLVVIIIKGPVDNFPPAHPLDVALHLPTLDGRRPSRGCYLVAQPANLLQ